MPQPPFSVVYEGIDDAEANPAEADGFAVRVALLTEPCTHDAFLH